MTFNDDPIARLVGGSARWREWWNSWRSDPDSDVDLAYVALGALAHEAVRRSRAGQLEDLEELLGSVEQVVALGDAPNRRLIALGFLEAMQNRYAEDKQGLDSILGMMGPRTRALWGVVHDYWQRFASDSDLEREFRRP